MLFRTTFINQSACNIPDSGPLAFSALGLPNDERTHAAGIKHRLYTEPHWILCTFFHPYLSLSPSHFAIYDRGCERFSVLSWFPPLSLGYMLPSILIRSLENAAQLVLARHCDGQPGYPWSSDIIAVELTRPSGDGNPRPNYREMQPFITSLSLFCPF